jgi:hypothetical protein
LRPTTTGALRPALALAVLILICAGTPAVAQNNACDQAGEFPDVIVGDLYQLNAYGSSGGFSAYSVGTISCNVGTCWLNWIDDTNQHPVIGQNMFRYKNGRFEQIGQSWLKHGFTALSQELCHNDCISTTGTHLGVHCSDPYSANLNGQQSNLGPKFEVNAHTGAYPYPPTNGSQTGNTIFKRVQVPTVDVDPAQNAGALYVVEGQYVAADDAAAGKQDNNASWRRVNVTPSSASFVSGQPTQRQEPAIFAWSDFDPGVVLKSIRVPSDGLLWLGTRVTDLGNGTWHYEYALQNLNSHRSVRSFSIPRAAGLEITNVGFHDVHYHSGEPFSNADWTATVTDTSITWATQTHSENQNANALRWGTLYNFRFDANAPPIDGAATLGLFRPGTPSSVFGPTSVPQEALECDLDGTCDGIENRCNCPEDCGQPLAVEAACDDGIDEDCDGATDCADGDCCWLSSCPPSSDGDGDDVNAVCDCDDGIGTCWETPGEARSLTLAEIGGETVLAWSPPADPGGSATRYETIRSPHPLNWLTSGAVCLASSDPQATTNVEIAVPAPDATWFYLIRAVNDCPQGDGSLGRRTDGQERKAIDCP